MPQCRFVIVLVLLFSFQMYIEMSNLVTKRLWLTSARQVWFHLWTQINDLFIEQVTQTLIWVRNLKWHQILFESGMVPKIQVSWFIFLVSPLHIYGRDAICFIQSWSSYCHLSTEGPFLELSAVIGSGTFEILSEKCFFCVFFVLSVSFYRKIPGSKSIFM